jgi:outer membrane receptor for ferrienterochelin and colicin
MLFIMHRTLLAKRRVFLFLLLLLIPAHVWAQTSPHTLSPPSPIKGEGDIEQVQDEGEPSADIGVVTVEGAQDTESIEAPGAFTTVIKPTQFERRMKSAPELLSETVGVDVTSLGGEGSLSTVSIRGSSAEQVAVFVDGVRINSALTGAVDFSTIPTDSIERIEVIRGAASTRFGTDAIGGVINIVTKKAGAKRAIDLKLTGASFSTLQISESWREPRENWDLVFAHNHRSTAGDFTFKSLGITLAGGTAASSQTYTRLHNRSISEDVLTKVRFDITDAIHIGISNDFFWTDRQVPGLEIETTQLYPANPLEADEEIFRDTTALRLNLDKLFVDELSFEAGATHFFDHDHFTDPSPAIGDPIDVTYLSLAPEAYFQLIHDLSLKHLTLISTLRGQYRYDYADDSSPIATAPLMGSHGRHTPALFLEEELALLNERLGIIPSGRIESATSRKTRGSWRVGIIGTPANFIDIKASVGTAFRYPAFSELYFPDQGYLRGNPNLKDERSLSWDAGVVVKPPRSTIQVSYFRSYIDNQILFVPISATTIQPINTGRANAQGVEFSFSTEPLDWLHLDGNYTWLDATFEGNNLRLPGRPQHKANAHAEVRIKPVTLFGDVQYVGSFPLNAANTVRISSHSAANAGATLTFAKRFFATFEVKDITDVQIYDARGFPLPRRSYWMSVGAKT